METRASTQAVAGHGGPAGTVHVVDPHPLNWLYITWNTMEEPVRTNEKGNIVGAAMEDSHWEGATLVVKVREGIRFQDGTTLTAHSIRRFRRGAEVEGAAPAGDVSELPSGHHGRRHRRLHYPVRFPGA
jgi:hypothetical protein